MSSDLRVMASIREKKIQGIMSLVDFVERDLESDESKTLLSASFVSEVMGVLGDDANADKDNDKRMLYLRQLHQEERYILKDACRCSCANDDWSKIILSIPPDDQNRDYCLDLKSLVSATHFDGFCVLDMNPNNVEEESNDWSAIPPGLHSNICVRDSVVCLRSCRVYRNTLVSMTYIGKSTVLMNCGRVSVEDSSTAHAYGNMRISVGAESGGGRSLSLTSESTMIDVCRQLQSRDSADGDAPPLPMRAFDYNVLWHGSVVCDTPKVQSVFLWPNSSIEAACSVQNATLLAKAKISSGSIVSNVLMQWNASISGNSKVNNVCMMEESHLGPSSIVESTVMGPDAHASAGEIHASVIGPNTNAHHQSLVIGVLWPLGRGNVAYGANVGSNHTGRLPDQECGAGEGIFWGLSCIVKFPIDLSSAAYSVVAAGTKLAPQRITMPFSLITESSSSSSDKGSPLTDIVPGWVLQHSPYTLARNEKKFATRRKALRHAEYTGWKILRPSTIERCRIARNELRKSLHSEDGDALLLQDVPGIGECRLTERARDCGISAYTNCIRLYALRGLLSWLADTFDIYVNDKDSINLAICSTFPEESVENLATDHHVADSSSRVEWPPVPWEYDDSSDRQVWEYQRKLLLEEHPMIFDCQIVWIRTMLDILSSMEKDYAERIAKSKRRDDTRGAATIPGYAEFHVNAEMDPVVMEGWEKQEITQLLIEKLLTEIDEI